MKAGTPLKEDARAGFPQAHKEAVITRREVGALALVFVLFLAVNVFTGTRYPIVWVDEVMFTDPAANLALGNGFRSSAWAYQDADRPFAGYPPIYPAALSLWIRLTGLHPLGSRSLNYVLAVLAATALWLGVARHGLVRTPRARLLLVLLLLLGYSISMGYRGGRPDTLMLFLSALLLPASAIAAPLPRSVALVFLGALLPLASLALLPCAVIIAALLLVYGGRRLLSRVLCVLAGLAIGYGSLMLAYRLSGVYDAFRAATQAESSGGLIGVLLFGHAFTHENKVPKDPSLILLFLAGVMLALSQAGTRRFRWNSVLSFGLAAAVAVPLAMVAAAKFPTYYAWMAYVPLAVGVTSALSASPGGAVMDVPGRSLLVLACLLGLPLQLGLSAYDWEDRDHRAVEALVDRNVRRQDWVYGDHSVYYAAKARAERVFMPRYLDRASDAERAGISVLILSPRDRERVQALVGGAWRRVDEGLTPRRGTFFEDVISLPLRFGNIDRKYVLEVYRRVGSAASVRRR